MAVKAVAIITDLSFDTSEDNLSLSLKICAHSGIQATATITDLDPSATDLTLDSQVRTFVRAYVENEMGIEVGLLDTVRVLFKLNSLV